MSTLNTGNDKSQQNKAIVMVFQKWNYINGHVIYCSEYKEYHTDTSVRFVVKMTGPQYQKAESEGLYKYFKLQGVIHTSNMVNCYCNMYYLDERHACEK